MSQVKRRLAIEHAAYGIVPAKPARRAGSGVPPNISDTFF